MKPIPLFEDSAEDLCELIKALHVEMMEMREEMKRGFDVLLAVKTDDTESLRAMVVAGPSLVVPFEDESVPALATCPTCGKTAETEEQVEERFGYRTPEGRDTIKQSWCRECRILDSQTRPKTKTPLPDDIRAIGKKARAMFKLALKKDELRASALKASSGRETKESVAFGSEAQSLRIEGTALLAQYDAERGLLRKNKRA